MTHMPLARRYRPQKFSDVIGQPQATRALQNALISQKTTHAYLFSGTRGCGKTTLARLLAKAVNCLQLTPEGEPCQNCASCREIASSCSLDVIEIDGASHRGIDDIRQIKESVGFQPSTGKFKVYIVDEVHMLTKEAFNALLKTLEEPPSTVKFILATTEPHKVPATISSRCQKFALRNIEPSLVVQALEKILAQESVSYEPELLWHLGRRSEGSLRDCLSLLDQLLAFEPEKR
jgi:DNA polymerase-3 subunit gamma/tau